MSDDVKETYSPGLAGVIAGESAICWVHPDAGLLYRGYDIHELAKQSSFEEVTWLLLHGELPTMEQCDGFKSDLAAERSLPHPVLEMLRLLPAGTHPMDALRTGVSMLAAFDPDLNDNSRDADLRKAVRLIAKVSRVIADGWRITHSKEPWPSDPTLNHAGNFLLTLNDNPPEEWEIEILDTVLILYADHEFNASTFSARVTASTMSDIYSAVTTGIGTLKGPLHGGANEESMGVLEQIGSPEQVETWVKERLARNEKVMGFGHRVYKSGDSRVPVMRELARGLGERTGEIRWVAICESLEQAMWREKSLCANVDLYAAVVLRLLGIPAALNPAIFACSRVAGWCAHVIEQHGHNRLIRPRSLYTGPERRELPLTM
jgi:2-methylcitrate synthase/citrate synthase II